MADKAAIGKTAMRSAAWAAQASDLKLQSDYAHAVMWSKGYAAEETKAAFARAGDLGGETRMPPRTVRSLLSASGLRSYMRGEHRLGASDS